MNIAAFQHYGPSHLFALVFTVIGGFFMVRLMRSEATEELKRGVRFLFGGLLIFAVCMDPVLTFLRFGTGEMGWLVFWSSSLPLYLCDVASIIAGVALITKNFKLTELAYLWGLAGTSQGLLTPTLAYDWDTLDYYNFFLQHSGVPVAAVTLVWGMGIVPRKGALKRVVMWSWVYMVTVVGINFLIKQNYGFLSGKPDSDTMLDFMGPYPYYLLTLQAVAFVMYSILLKISSRAKIE